MVAKNFLQLSQYNEKSSRGKLKVRCRAGFRRFFVRQKPDSGE